MALTENDVKELKELSVKLDAKGKEVESAVLYLDEVVKAGNSYYSRANAVEMLAKAQHAYIITLTEYQSFVNKLNSVHISYLQAVVAQLLEARN